MAKIRYASKIACLSAKKVDIAYIYSGATNYFFFNCCSFETYETTDAIEVENAAGMSKIVAKGIVTLSVEDGSKIEAFHAPEFESNIV